MRTLLINSIFIFGFTNLFAQGSFMELDRKTYEYYLKGDYKNLKNTGDSMISMGIDYYYLRMRMGILANNHQQYAASNRHFSKALEMNSWDTLSQEYIYYSYLFAGREADAILYLESIPWGEKNHSLKAILRKGLTEINMGSSVSNYNPTLYDFNDLYYEAVENSFSINAGIEGNFSDRIKGTIEFTNFHKWGTSYSSYDPTGTNLDFSQNQIYGKVTGSIFPGWDISAFGQVAFYENVTSQTQQGYGRAISQINSESVGGVGISKNGWKIRTGFDFSYSNFSNFNNSRQLRMEGYLTYLPFGNLNLYATSGGMYQTDNNWGSTYQINQLVGFKTFKFLWFETGMVMGNSFLYARNQGYAMNNSYQIPATTIYGNLSFLLGEQWNIALTPYYTKNLNYSWDLDAYTKTDEQINKSMGGAIKLTFKFK